MLYLNPEQYRRRIQSTAATVTATNGNNLADALGIADDITTGLPIGYASSPLHCTPRQKATRP